MPYYDAIAESYNELHGEEQIKKLDIISKYISPRQKQKLLDVGCGTGICSHWNCFCVGIDPSIGLLKQGKGNLIQAEGEHLPFKDKSFDFVVSVTAIHLFYDVDKGLEEIKRVGKNNFILTVLKKSSRHKEISNKIKSMFKVKEMIEEERDSIYIIK